MKLLDLLHSSITGLDRPLGSRRFRLPEFLDSWHMKIVRMSTFAPDAFIPPPTGDTPGTRLLISVRSWADPRAIVRPEELSKWKIPTAPPGIEPAINYHTATTFLTKLKPSHEELKRKQYNLRNACRTERFRRILSVFVPMCYIRKRFQDKWWVLYHALQHLFAP